MCSISRVFAMPNSNTFEVAPIRAFVKRHLDEAKVVVDPFARDSQLATITNDLNPNTQAQHHMEARDFLRRLIGQGVIADAVILDPPYSPRQIAECYKIAGLPVTMKDTQNAALMRECRDLVRQLVRIGGKVLSFGWNSCTMGEGWQIDEILLCSHRGAHNDTICKAERRVAQQLCLEELRDA